MKKYEYEFYKPEIEKQNKQYEINYEEKQSRSISSTKQHSFYKKSSSDSLQVYRLESMILELQKEADQQQFELQTLTEESNMYQKVCEEQKQVIFGLDIESLRAEYQEQVDELIAQKKNAQQIIIQLRQDYEQRFTAEQNKLNEMKNINLEISAQMSQELDYKRNVLSLLTNKDRKIQEQHKQIQQAEERLDELRNVQRKMTIAVKQLKRLRGQ